MRKLVLAVGLVLGSASFALPVQAQSLLVTGDEDTDTPTTDTDTPAADADQASTTSTLITPEQPSTNPFASSSATITPPQILGGDRAATSKPTPRERPPKSVSEIVSPENLGMTPQQYAEAIKNLEKKAVLQPDVVLDDPLFQIEMLKTGEQITKTMDKRVRESCDIAAFTIRFDPNGWTPAARDALKTKGIGTLASAIDSICRDKEEKEKVMTNLYAIGIRNTQGEGSPKVGYEDGSFILSGDFSQISDEFSVPALKSQLMAAAQKDAEHLEKLMPQINEIAKNYPGSSKSDTTKP